VLAHADALVPLLVVAAVGGGIGAVLAGRVEMTAMPELVALLHSFVGLAAVGVGVATAMGSHVPGVEGMVHRGEIGVDIAIGAVTFTGSVVAFLKLRGTLSGAALRIPARHLVTGFLALAILAGIGAYAANEAMGVGLAVATVVAAVLGVLLIHAIGGADMPVAVSLLNSYSGWTASAAGFVLSNDLLIVTGALVGSSGAILSTIMCRAMNRSIWNVVFGDFGATTTTGPVDAALADAVARGVNSATVDEAAEILKGSSSVIVVPGYGMAVAQAQNTVRELAHLLEEAGATVRYAIHPVAGRLPGHMNVLLAEANVPYDQVLEMDEINADFPTTDAVLVLGANDIVNPAALEDPTSPLYGMPTLEVHRARTVFVVKRSMAAGYSGVDNPLYYRPNTLMVFGDARKVVEGMVKALER
jgi:NAD(P) transhydrogenase subunit beta